MGRPKTPPENSIKRVGGYFPVCREWFNSDAYRALTPLAKCLLMEFQNIHYNGRNGTLSISVENAAKRLNVTQKTARAPFHELAEHGFIALTKGQYWQERLAREWRITFYGCNGREPTDEWRMWSPGQPIVLLATKRSASKKAA